MKRTTSRLVAALIATSTVFGISRANARTVPNLERSTQWSAKDGVVGFVNECDKSVDVLFMPLDRPFPTERKVAKGERFSTGLSQSQLRLDWLDVDTLPCRLQASRAFQVKEP